MQQTKENFFQNKSKTLITLNIYSVNNQYAYEKTKAADFHTINGNQQPNKL